jgi:hypothetical protein
MPITRERDTTTQTPNAGDVLAALLPGLRRQDRAADPDKGRLAELRKLLAPDEAAIEAAIEPTSTVVAQLTSSFERDVSSLTELSRQRRRGLDTAIEFALVGARGGLDLCLGIGGRQRSALDKIRGLSTSDVHHSSPAVVAAALRERFAGLATFPAGIAELRRRLDDRLQEITQRLAVAPPVAPPTAPPLKRGPGRPPKAKTGSPRFEEEQP